MEEVRRWRQQDLGARQAFLTTTDLRSPGKLLYYPRPLLCVALDALNACKIKVHDQKLPSQAEFSVKTVERAREDRLYVRFSNLCLLPVESPYTDLFDCRKVV